MSPRLCGLPAVSMADRPAIRNGHTPCNSAPAAFPESVLALLVADAIKHGEPFLPPFWFSRKTVARWMHISQQRLNARLRDAGVDGNAHPLLDVRDLGRWLIGNDQG